MKSLYKKLSIVAILFFLVSIIGVAYHLYNASADISYALQLRESSRIELIAQALRPATVFIGIETFLGLLAILLLLVGKQHSSTNVNYTERIQVDLSKQADTSGSANMDKRIEVIQTKLQISYPDATTKIEKILTAICNELEACQGAIFQTKQNGNKRFVEMCASYAYFMAESKTISYEFGEGLTGQVAKEGKLLNISSVPEGYITIISGLGRSSPKNLIVVPIMSYAEVIGVIEIASFKPFTKQDEILLNELSPLLAGLLPIQYQMTATI